MIGACSGAGVTIGPVVGAFIFALTGYMGPFLFSALGNLILTVAILATIPKSVDTPTECADKEGEEHVKESLVDLLSHKRILFAFSARILGCIVWGFPEPVLTDHMENVYGASTVVIGFAFGAFSTGYVLGSLSNTSFLERYTAQTAFIVGIAALGIVCLFLGPASWLPFEGSNLTTTFFMFCLGFAVSYTIVPVVMEC